MVSFVDVRSNERCSFRIRASDHQVGDAHDIVLKSDSHQAVDMFGDGHQHFSSHVSALLGPGSLIFNVNPSSTFLNEELGELHCGGETAVAGISIGDDRTQVIDSRSCGELRGGEVGSALALFSVVEELGLEEVLDFVGDGVIGVV